MHVPLALQLQHVFIKRLNHSMTVTNAVADVSAWRLVDHLRPDVLSLVPSDHAAVPAIKALQPASACKGGCQYGYCTWPATSDVAKAASGPACVCFPDLAVTNGGECVRASHRGRVRLDCPDSCSELGTCIRGFCACPPGASSDCAVSCVPVMPFSQAALPLRHRPDSCHDKVAILWRSAARRAAKQMYVSCRLLGS